jgi:hypothetical protein
MFFETRNNQIRFYDWNKVETTCGTMMEPRQLINLRGNRASQFSWKDQCAKVNHMVCAELRELDALLSDGQKITISGTQIPQDFSF